MDRRTILFILVVSASFFGLNIYFSHQRDQRNRDVLQQQTAQKSERSAQMQTAIKKRVIPLSQLPVVKIWGNEEQTQRLGFGISDQKNLITLAWARTMPEQIYVEGISLFLATKESVIDGPVVYGPKDFYQLDIASVPEIGTFDIQVVTLPENKNPEVYLGEYRDGAFSLVGDRLSQDAIGMYKGPSGWLPLGFYEHKGNVFIELQDLPLLSKLSKIVAPKQLTTSELGEEKFYVLENDYAQLVFSNFGGALAEINLPFETEEDPSSVVKEIGFDREIAEHYPANAHFPAHSYYLPGSNDLNPPGPIGGFYPLIRRGIKNKKTISISPQYYAANIVSEYPEMAELTYQVKSFTKDSITFEAMQPHRKITKTFRLAKGDNGAPYTIELDLNVEGDSRGLWITSGVPEVEIMSNSSNPRMQYRITRKGKSEVEKLSLPKIKEVVSVSSVYPDWVVNSNGYLGIILDPLSEIGPGYQAKGIPGTVVPTRLAVIDPKNHPYPASKYPGYQVMLPLPVNGSRSLQFRLYTGPFDEAVLKAVDKAYSDPETGYNPDYTACWTFYGWFSFISEPFSKMLFFVMKFFHSITGSWGLSIILLTVFLRLLLYPLNAWSFKSMRRMQQLAPQIKAIQQKNKKDPKRGQLEVMALYREKKVNPFMGCLPILIQIPFLIAMFDLLKSSFALRGASFIPGWIDNLTAPDVLFQWKTPIFFIGNQFHLLPVLLGGVMFIQQRVSAGLSGKDPSKMSDQQRQQKSMGTMMTVVFTVMFYHFPSGLNIYWLSSMSLGILQQWLTNKVLTKKEKTEAIEVQVLPAKKTKGKQ